MPRKCTICTHVKRQEIDEALISGVSFRNVAKQFGLSITAIHRHNTDHLAASLVKAKEAEEMTRADDLLIQLRSLQRRALDILDKAENTGDLRTAIAAIREARGNLELLAKLLGELKEGQVVNILVAPEWLEIRTVILTTLRPYPQAIEAVTTALSRVKDVSR